MDPSHSAFLLEWIPMGFPQASTLPALPQDSLIPCGPPSRHYSTRIPPGGSSYSPPAPLQGPSLGLQLQPRGSRWAEPLSGLIHDCTMENCSLRCPWAARNCCSTLKVPLPSFCTDPGAWRNVLFTWGRYWALLTKATPCSPSATKICLLNPTQ